MTDQKLPVILRPIYIGHIGGNIMASHFHPDGIASIDPTLETVKYEPVVPRCKTCDSWVSTSIWPMIQPFCRSTFSNYGNGIKRDADDYCSRHSGLRK